MERKHVFNDISKEYEKARPTYPSELFDDIVEYSGIDESGDILEIGYGTGQATQGFVDKNYKRITCVELGKNHSSDEYIALLNTHSKHRQLPEDIRELLFSEIRKIIDSHGGDIIKPQLGALFLGKRSSI